jgi:uncharacterized membrane protein YccC
MQCIIAIRHNRMIYFEFLFTFQVLCDLMAELRWLPPLEFPISPESMARFGAGLKLGVLTMLAFGLALFTSFEALIDMAGLAGMCAAILSLPDPGAVFAKSYARLFGTVVGGVACVALYWIFPQAPWLFAGGLALWMGMCAFWGTKLKYFGSYASILGGYTAALVAKSTPNPEDAIRIAGERVSVIVIGILAVALVWGVFHIRKGFQAYLPPLREMSDRITAQIVQVVNEPESYDHVATMRVWARDIEAMHQSLEYAGAEDPEVALHARSVRCGLNEFFADIADFNIRLKELGLLLQDSPHRIIADEINREILAAFKARLDEPDDQADARMVKARERVLDYFAAQSEPDYLGRIRLLAEIDAARKLIDTMNRVRRGRETYDKEDIRPLGQATSFSHSLYVAAVVVFTFMVGWGVYIVNEWDSAGLLFIVMTAILVQLVSVSEDPVGGIKNFQLGVFGCVFPALLCSQVLMPLGSGFPWLILSFSVIIIPCCILRSFPKTQVAGNTFMIFGMMLSLPDNQMQYDLQGFLNNLQAMMASWTMVLASVLIFFPIRNRDKAMRIERRGYQDLMALPHHLRKDRFQMWEDKQQERVCSIDRIGSLKNTVVAQEAINALLMMMRLGRCFRRQRDDLAGLRLPAHLRQRVNQAEWFWSRQIESPERFQHVVGRLVDALVAESLLQPTHQLELQAAAQSWRMISKNNQVLASLPC